MLWQAAKIGCDTFVGELAGGMQAWSAAGLPIGSVPLADATTDDVRVHAAVRESAVMPRSVLGVLTLL